VLVFLSQKDAQLKIHKHSSRGKQYKSGQYSKTFQYSKQCACIKVNTEHSYKNSTHVSQQKTDMLAVGITGQDTVTL